MVNDRYLAHHGIKNQKWGVKNGPPYPLKPSDHSAAEKKALGEGTKKKTEPSKQKEKKESDPETAARRKEILKKVGIGMGVAVGTVVAVKMASKGMKYLNENPEHMTKLVNSLTDNDVARGIADFGSTAQQFKSNVQKNAEKARYNLEANARERARTARTEFEKAESAYMGKKTRGDEQKATADAMDFIRKNRNNKYDAISRSKAQDLMKKYNISDNYSDEMLKSRSNMHRNAANNLYKQQRDLSESYSKAAANYLNANGSNEKNKRKREKMQRIMREALAERK